MAIHNWTQPPAYSMKTGWGKREYYQGIPLAGSFNYIDGQAVWTGMAPIAAHGYKRMYVTAGHNTYTAAVGLRLDTSHGIGALTGIAPGSFIYMRSNGWSAVKQLQIIKVMTDYISGGSSNDLPETILLCSKTYRDGWPNPRLSSSSITTSTTRGGDGITHHGYRWNASSHTGNVEITTEAAAWGDVSHATGDGGGNVYKVAHISNGPETHSSEQNLITAYTTAELEGYSACGYGHIGVNFYKYYAPDSVNYPWHHASLTATDRNALMNVSTTEDMPASTSRSVREQTVKPGDFYDTYAEMIAHEGANGYETVGPYKHWGSTSLKTCTPYGHNSGEMYSPGNMNITGSQADDLGICPVIQQRTSTYKPYPVTDGESKAWPGKYGDAMTGYLNNPPDGVIITMQAPRGTTTITSTKATGTVTFTGVPAEDATVTITAHGDPNYVPTGSSWRALNPTLVVSVFRFNESDPSDADTIYVHKGDNVTEAAANLTTAINAVSGFQISAVSALGVATLTSKWGFIYNNNTITDAGDTGSLIAVTGMSGASAGAGSTPTQPQSYLGQGMMCVDVIVDLYK